ncbi:pyridoxal phosphate-dependent aminotransferase [soil metagenome]|nr:aminotransferase class I/II-fold pyridoxal phosphate-dependent enzyme [Gemmatimonadota bacterium]
MEIPDFQLERFFARWEFAAPYILCASDVEGWPMAELLALADAETRGLWGSLTLGYTEAAGHPLLRAEIASLYAHVAPEEVLVFAGAEEAIFAFMNVALGPGDHLIVTWPGYQSLHEVARAAGAEVELLPLDPAAGWALDLDALRARLRPSTRALVVNFPHNPTGALPDRGTWDALVEIARAAGVHLFSDEVYRFLEFDPADRLPAAVDCGEGGISLGVMSKSFALAGLRIGWIATHDPGLLRRLAAFKDYTTICNSAPSEILALIALRSREQVLARSRGIVERNLQHLDRFFEEWQGIFEWVRPRAGSVGFPRLLADVPIDSFARELVEGEGVLLLPGGLFDYPDNHFRLGFGRTNLPEALMRLERFAARRLRGGRRE